MIDSTVLQHRRDQDRPAAAVGRHLWVAVARQEPAARSACCSSDPNLPASAITAMPRKTPSPQAYRAWDQGERRWRLRPTEAQQVPLRARCPRVRSSSQHRGLLCSPCAGARPPPPPPQPARRRRRGGWRNPQASAAEQPGRKEPRKDGAQAIAEGALVGGCESLSLGLRTSIDNISALGSLLTPRPILMHAPLHRSGTRPRRAACAATARTHTGRRPLRGQALEPAALEAACQARSERLVHRTLIAAGPSGRCLGADTVKRSHDAQNG